ncbi:MAG: carboxypeptidase-like regulatory domain-containing protein [Deltaproteobacteria bacterium]|nr:carboxypeptidase-like regulatory domain-containing protein [Deltaproteobacteria bacterium]
MTNISATIFKRLVLVCIVFFLSGCYATISGTVIDAETGEPIEGAVVLAEWTVTKGAPGLTHTDSYKVIEAVTNKDGVAAVSGVFNPFVNKPSLTVYKKGYVAWNNQYIFPDYKKREDFKWQDGAVIRLERFKEGYMRDDHVRFIESVGSTHRNTEQKMNFKAAYFWEIVLASEERDIKAKKHKNKE